MMPISPAKNRCSIDQTRHRSASDQRNRHGGFTLLEMALTLMVIGLIAALGLPFSRPTGSATALRSKALEIVSLLRAERNLAVRSGQTTFVRINVEKGLASTSRPEARIQIPSTMTVRILPLGASSFEFYGDGRSSGGRISLVSNHLTCVIDVNRLTAAVEFSGV